MDRSRPRLVDLLEVLPDDALLPVAWLRAQLDIGGTSQLAAAADLSAKAFAKLVERGAGQVRAWCAAGEVPGAYRLPGTKRHGAWRIPAAGVAAFRERKPSPNVVSESAPQVADIGAWRTVRRLRRA